MMKFYLGQPEAEIIAKYHFRESLASILETVKMVTPYQDINGKDLDSWSEEFPE